MSKYFVYALCYPDTLSPFYIGYSQHRSRPMKHITEAKKKNRKKCRNRKINTIRKIFSKGQEPVIEIVFRSSNKKVALDKEIELIKFYGRLDLKTGILTNLTNGGEGASCPSYTRRRQLHLQMSGENNPMFGKNHTEESKLSMSKNQKKYKQDNEIIWITNGDLEMQHNTINEMAAGWVRGRSKKSKERLQEHNKINGTKNKGRKMSKEAIEKSRAGKIRSGHFFDYNKQFIWAHKTLGEYTASINELINLFPEHRISPWAMKSIIPPNKRFIKHSGWQFINFIF